MVMDCQLARDSLSELLDGGLDPATALEVEAHLAACGGCSREREALARTVALVHGLPRRAAPEGFATSVREALDRARGPEGLAEGPLPVPLAGREPRRGSFSHWALRGLAAAAVLLLVVQAALLLAPPGSLRRVALLGGEDKAPSSTAAGRWGRESANRTIEAPPGRHEDLAEEVSALEKAPEAGASGFLGRADPRPVVAEPSREFEQGGPPRLETVKEVDSVRDAVGEDQGRDGSDARFMAGSYGRAVPPEGGRKGKVEETRTAASGDEALDAYGYGERRESSSASLVLALITMDTPDLTRTAKRLQQLAAAPEPPPVEARLAPPEPRDAFAPGPSGASGPAGASGPVETAPGAGPAGTLAPPSPPESATPESVVHEPSGPEFAGGGTRRDDLPLGEEESRELRIEVPRSRLSALLAALEAGDEGEDELRIEDPDTYHLALEGLEERLGLPRHALRPADRLAGAGERRSRGRDGARGGKDMDGLYGEEEGRRGEGSASAAGADAPAAAPEAPTPASKPAALRRVPEGTGTRFRLVLVVIEDPPEAVPAAAEPARTEAAGQDR